MEEKLVKCCLSEEIPHPKCLRGGSLVTVEVLRETLLCLFCCMCYLRRMFWAIGEGRNFGVTHVAVLAG